jgi:uncharacterized protein (TIGR04255 family)
MNLSLAPCAARPTSLQFRLYFYLHRRKNLIDHEIYPRAPLVLVAVEVRFPGTNAPSGPLSSTMLRQFRKGLGDKWVLDSVQTQQFAVAFGPEGAIQQAPKSTSLPVFTVRDRTTSIALTSQSLNIQTTRYRHYPQFREVLETAMRLTEELLEPEGVARVGMRYIDEIRIHREGAHKPDWSEWLDRSLLAPGIGLMQQQGMSAVAWNGIVHYQTGPNRALTLNYGLREGSAISPLGHVRPISAPQTGPQYTLDFDSFWQPTDIPEFDASFLLKTCDELRVPARALFDNLITERLRTEFRKESSDA